MNAPAKPLLVCDWDRVLMMHFEVDPMRLQADTAFPLDLHHGQAWVTLVAFTLRGLRLRLGGLLGRWLLSPVANHEFLNVRTYVRHAEEPGIQFLAEWVPNRLSHFLGPRLFSLPYRLGTFDYQHHHETGVVSGEVRDAGSDKALRYQASLADSGPPQPCHPESLDAWLMERYAAFNAGGRHPLGFRVWHEPWLQWAAQVHFEALQLIEDAWPWFAEARFAGAHYSPGLRQVGMSQPIRLIANLEEDAHAAESTGSFPTCRPPASGRPDPAR